jgi:NADH-quinone oxidoreductase subunit A
VESGAGPYEVVSKEIARSAISFRFLRLTIVFILFSIVAVFLYPWAVVFHQLRMYGFLAMLSFLLLVAPGYVYLWKKGVFDLARPDRVDMRRHEEK